MLIFNGTSPLVQIAVAQKPQHSKALDIFPIMGERNSEKNQVPMGEFFERGKTTNFERVAHINTEFNT